MAICDIILTPERYEQLANVAVKELQEIIANDEDFDIDKTLRDFYIRGIEAGQSVAIMVAYVQQFPRIYDQVIGHAEDFNDYLVEKDFNRNKLSKLRKNFKDFDNVIEFLKEDKGLSKKRIQELKELKEKEAVSSTTNSSGPIVSLDPENITGEVVYEAQPRTLLSTITRPHKFAPTTETQRQEDENEQFYLGLKKQFARLLNKNKDLTLDKATLGGHTGFKLTIMSQTNLRDEDLRVSHRKRKNDKTWVDYRWDPESKKDITIKTPLDTRKKQFEAGVSAIITDIEGNILYFKQNADDTYSVVDKTEGKAIYDNIRKNSKLNNKKDGYTTLQTFEEISENTGQSIKLIKKKFKEQKEELDNIVDFIKADKKNNKVIQDIVGVNPGYMLRVNSSKRTLLNDINWEESLIAFDPEFTGSEVFIDVHDDLYDNIRVFSPSISETDYYDIIIKLASSPRLEVITRRGTKKTLSTSDRIKYLNNYFFDYKIQFLKDNKGKFVVKVDGEIIDSNKEIKKILENVLEKYTLNINKTLLQKNKIDNIESIEDNILTVSYGIDYTEWIKNNHFTQLKPNSNGVLPILGGYYVYALNNEYKLNSKNQSSIKEITSVQNKVTNKNYLTTKSIIEQIIENGKFVELSEDKTQYIRYDSKKNIVKTYNRVTDFITEKNDVLKIFSELDRNDLFISNDGLIDLRSRHEWPNSVRNNYEDLEKIEGKKVYMIHL